MDRRYRLAGWVLAGLGGVAGSFAVAGASAGFIVTPVEGTLARTMPGIVVSLAILLLGSLGQQLSLATAVLLGGVGLGFGGAVGGRVGAAAGASIATALRRPGAVAGAGAAAWAVGAVATGMPLSALGAGVGVAAVVAVAFPDIGVTVATEPAAAGGVETTDAGRDDRRGALRALGAAAGLTAIGIPLGVLRGGRSAQPMSDPGTREYDVGEQLQAADRQSLDVSGLEPLVSEEFYQVDINAVDPTVDEDAYTLSVEGAVENPLTASLATLKADFPREDRFVTLRCVGETLNGKKMDTAVWTGVPVDAIIDRVGPEAESLVLRAADDYFVGFPLEALRGGLLAYGMNGGPLPRGHGAPLRALVPGHWGEVNTKWLTTIEVVDEPVTGYWEQRGWHGTGPVNTVAKLHAVDRSDGRITVGGHAYAGEHGIERVEVSTDGGASWVDATLSEPLPGEDVWRQWAHTYPAPGSRHDVVVRATDGTGTLQPETRDDAFPSGPTGWVTKTLRG